MNTEPKAENQERSFRDMVSVLRRRLVLITSTIVICLLLAVGVTLLMEPMYGSTTLIVLEGRTRDFSTINPYDPLNALSFPNPTDDLPTQVEELMSLGVYEEALQRAGVDAVRRNEDGSPRDPIIKAKQVGQSNIIALSAESSQADTALKLAAAVPNAYRDYVQKGLSTQLDGAILFMTNEIKQLQDKYHSTQQALNKFREENRITSSETESASRLATIGGAQADVRTAQQRYDSSVQSYESLVKERAKLVSTIKNPTLQDSDQLVETEKAKIADLKGQLEQKRAIFTDNSSAVKQLQAQVAAEEAYLKTIPKKLSIGSTIRNPLIDSYDSKVSDAKQAMDGAKAALESAKAGLAKTETDLNRFNQVKGRFDELTNESTSALQLLQHEQLQLEDLQVRRSKAKSLVNTVAAPSRPEIVRPIWLLNIAAGGVVGILFSILLVRVREGSDDRIWTADVALATAELPALGNIPLGSSKLPALITENSSAAQGDPYRMLRTWLINSSTGQAYRSVAITSALAEEGRSETAVNLATSMALGGHQVVLVDANFRNSRIAQLMNLSGGAGLAELLRGEGALRDVTKPTSTAGLHVISTGSSDKASSDLLGGEAFAKLLEELKDRYHFVIVDTTPCLAGADGPVVAAACEAAIFVVKLGTSRRSATRYCQDLLRRTRTNMLGIVTNRPGASQDTEYLEYRSA